MLLDLRVKDFVDQLATEAPTPGGGSVAAIAGALGAGLISMVCRLTLGKKGYEAVEEDMKIILEKSEALRMRMLQLIDEDSHAFDQVMSGFKLPQRDDQEKAHRARFLQEAYKKASDTPFAIAEYCLQILLLAEKAITRGNKNLISDVGVAAKVTAAALESAFMNIDINLPAIKDRDYVANMKTNMQEIKYQAEASTQKTYLEYDAIMGS